MRKNDPVAGRVCPVVEIRLHLDLSVMGFVVHGSLVDDEFFFGHSFFNRFNPPMSVKKSPQLEKFCVKG